MGTRQMNIQMKHLFVTLIIDLVFNFRSISSSVASTQQPGLVLNRSMSTNTENCDVDSLPEDIGILK